MTERELVERFDGALGALGLHNQRRYSAPTDDPTDIAAPELRRSYEPETATAEVSLAELEKIADAVVEIERLLFQWYREAVKGIEGDAGAEAVYLWCEAHDWSNVIDQ
jgi:hypothetical protein